MNIEMIGLLNYDQQVNALKFNDSPERMHSSLENSSFRKDSNLFTDNSFNVSMLFIA